jgi:hypothetical protein
MARIRQDNVCVYISIAWRLDVVSFTLHYIRPVRHSLTVINYSFVVVILSYKPIFRGGIFIELVAVKCSYKLFNSFHLNSIK